jgi:hypothetical protein
VGEKQYIPDNVIILEIVVVKRKAILTGISSIVAKDRHPGIGRGEDTWQVFNETKALPVNTLNVGVCGPQNQSYSGRDSHAI